MKRKGQPTTGQVTPASPRKRSRTRKPPLVTVTREPSRRVGRILTSGRLDKTPSRLRSVFDSITTLYEDLLNYTLSLVRSTPSCERLKLIRRTRIPANGKTSLTVFHLTYCWSHRPTVTDTNAAGDAGSSPVVRSSARSGQMPVNHNGITNSTPGQSCVRKELASNLPTFGAPESESETEDTIRAMSPSTIVRPRNQVSTVGIHLRIGCRQPRDVCSEVDC